MDALTALTTRASAAKLAAPAPSPADLDRMLEAAVRAPDHGRLRPWRFVVIEGEGLKRFGDLLVDQLREKRPDLPAEVVEKEREKPLRAPMIVLVAAKVAVDHPKIPVLEQILSAGVAAQNIFLAAHALGYGAMWKTGDAAYDPAIKAAFGLEPSDEIVGYLYLGTPAAPTPTPRPIEIAPLVTRWQ